MGGVGVGGGCGAGGLWTSNHEIIKRHIFCLKTLWEQNLFNWGQINHAD